MLTVMPHVAGHRNSSSSRHMKNNNESTKSAIVKKQSLAKRVSNRFKSIRHRKPKAKAPPPPDNNASQQSLDEPDSEEKTSSEQEVPRIHVIDSTASAIRQKPVPPPLSAAIPAKIGKPTTAVNNWATRVRVVLVEACGLLAADANGLSDPFCKIRLGGETLRSRVAPRTVNPQWREEFALFWDEDKASSTLHLTILDRDFAQRSDYLGQCSIDVGKMARNRMHDMWLPVVDGSGFVHVVVSVFGSATLGNEEMLTDGDIGIGSVKVSVLRATHLAQADIIGGKSDPYCVVELVNTHLQTHTIYGTLEPSWNCSFDLPIYDIGATLEISVLDEDRKNASDFLGRVAIPLTSVVALGSKPTWFGLKEQSLMRSAKGSVLLQFEMNYRYLPAALRCFRPKEKKWTDDPPSLKPQQFVENISRISAQLAPLISIGNAAQYALSWRNPLFSIVALLAYLVVVLTFQLWMLPAGALLALAINWVQHVLFGGGGRRQSTAEPNTAQSASRPMPAVATTRRERVHRSATIASFLTPSVGGSGENKTLFERLSAVPSSVIGLQETIGESADMNERIANLLTFRMPWYSYVAAVLLALAMLLFTFVGLRTLLAVLGVHKFAKTLLRRNSATQGFDEMIAFLSHLPTDRELLQYSRVTASASGRLQPPPPTTDQPPKTPRGGALPQPMPLLGPTTALKKLSRSRSHPPKPLDHGKKPTLRLTESYDADPTLLTPTTRRIWENVLA